MAMTWRHLLFAHWPIDADVLRPLIPDRLDIDTFDGSAWIALVPFTMTGIRARCTPALPWFGAFHELNVRTYVTDPAADDAGRPGVWFLSLDAANPVAVEIARRIFRLNYLHARMSLTTRPEPGPGDRPPAAFDYTSRRTDRRGRPGSLDVTYAPLEELRPCEEGLERWLIERYCLYSGWTPSNSQGDNGRADGGSCGAVFRAEINHAPWRVSPAWWEVRDNTMLDQFQLAGEPLLHYAERIDTVAWLPERLHPVHARTETGGTTRSAP
jgi:uncharacterized protein YqjF (DUF2071 family)